MFPSSSDPRSGRSQESARRIRELEAEAERNRQALSSVTVLAHAVTWTADATHRILTLTGEFPGSVSRDSVGALFGARHPESRDFPPLRASRDALRGKACEFAVASPGGPYRGCVNPFRDSEGQIIGTIGVAMPAPAPGPPLEQLPLSVEVFSPDGSLLRANPAWERLWQTEPPAGYNLLEDQQAVEPDLLPLIRKAFAGEEVRMGATRQDPPATVREGRPRWVEAILFPVREASGALREVVRILIDVTDRHRLDTERARLLRLEREARLRAEADGRNYRFLAELLPHIIWTALPDGTVDYMNRRWKDYAGEHEAGQGWAPLVHPNDHGAVERWRLALARAEGFEVECRLRRADGEYLWHLVRATPLRGGKDRLRRWFGTCTNIDDRKRAIDALRLNEERFRSLSAASPVGIFMADLEGRMVYVNPRCKAICGFSGDEGLGEGWTRFVHPEDRDRVLRNWFACAGQALDFSMEFRFRTPDGAVRWTHVRWSPVEVTDERLRGHVGTVEDITDRLRAEREIQVRETQQAAVAELGQRALQGEAVQQLMDDAVRLTASTLRVEFSKILERSANSEDLRMTAGVGWDGDAAGKVVFGTESGTQGAYALESREPVIVDDLRRETRFEGAEFLTEQGVTSGVTVLIHGRERPFGVLGAHTRLHRKFTSDDIHFLQAIANVLGAAIERKQAEQERERQAAALERSNDELRQFAYVASHDLQEPLRSVASFTQLLARRYQGKLGSDADEYIRYTVEGVARMSSLISDLLNYSRLVNPKPENFKAVDFNEVVRGAIFNLNRIITENEATVEVEEPLPTGRGDSTRLTQVFQNLIANALKYRSAETPVVRIRARSEPGLWRFSVEDNGIGIEKQYFEKIFGVFKRLHGSEYPGTGIGLASCKKIVEMHGGRIWLESEKGRGSTFHFTLPK